MEGAAWPAGLMCIGEGPGADEDRLGRPFVGRAGQLLGPHPRSLRLRPEAELLYRQHRDPGRPGTAPPSRPTGRPCLPYCGADPACPAQIIVLPAHCLQGIIDPSARSPACAGHGSSGRDSLSCPPITRPPARDPPKKKDVWHDMKQVIARYRELVDPNDYSAVRVTARDCSAWASARVILHVAGAHGDHRVPGAHLRQQEAEDLLVGDDGDGPAGVGLDAPGQGRWIRWGMGRSPGGL